MFIQNQIGRRKLNYMNHLTIDIPINNSYIYVSKFDKIKSNVKRFLKSKFFKILCLMCVLISIFFVILIILLINTNVKL